MRNNASLNIMSSQTVLCSRWFSSLILVFAFLLPPTLYAEDIQIYLQGGAEHEGSNVLFLIENSGGTNRNFCSGQGQGCQTFSGKSPAKTIDEIEFAMRRIADTMGATVKAGVAAQHRGGTDGGYIYYPVKSLLEQGLTIGAASTNRQDSDAYQDSNGQNFDVESPLLPLPGRPHPVFNTDTGMVAFYFEGLDVPRWAKVEQSTLTFKMPPNENFSTSQSFSMSFELNSDPALFSSQADIASRQWSDNFEVDVVAVNSGAGTYTLGGDGLVKMMQSVVARPDWCGRDDLVVRLTAAASNQTVPQVYSYRAENSEGARLGRTDLVVDWDATSSGVARPAGLTDAEKMSCMGGIQVGLRDETDDAVERISGGGLLGGLISAVGGLLGTLDNLVIGNTSGLNSGLVNRLGLVRNAEYISGLRFADAGIPQGALIAEASLNLHVLQGGVVRVLPILGDIEPFSVSGIIGAGNVGQGVDVSLGAGDVSIDVTAQVQQAVNSSGWEANASLGLRLDPLSGTTLLHSLSAGAGTTSASLSISLSSPSPGDFAQTVSRRDDLKRAISDMADGQGGGRNKLGSAYLEAGRYMLGMNERFDAGLGDPEAFLDPEARGRYLSPVVEGSECSASHIIKISHSNPGGDVVARPAINTVTAGSCEGDWACMSQLAAHLRNENVNQIGQSIVTHTVSFASATGGQSITEEMQDVAQAGGGMFRQASNAMDLVDAVKEILDRITVSDASMAAPGVAVNQLNRFEHLDQLYYALFRPSLRSRWDGNLKRYRLDFTGSQPLIVDELGQPAVDPKSGFFKTSSNSWWGQRSDGTDLPDGSDVTLGGAREELAFKAEERRLFVPNENGTDLVRLETANDISPTRLGLPQGSDNEDAEMLVDFLLTGWGDPLHSEPRLVNYGFTGSFADAVSNPERQDNVVFVATNDGAVHAVNANTGEEHFSFMPEAELEKTLLRFSSSRLNADDPQRDSYGLDGGITTWRRAANDGSGRAEAVYLYVAQRRGGNNVYALDVSDYKQPKMLWHISGSDSGFAKLGQTWASPTLTHINLNGERTPVMIIAGGYSPNNHDTRGAVSTSDSIGNAIYIVNALTGQKIWSVSSSGADHSHADMTMAIPAAVSVVDINFNGTADYLYAADLGGQVFRVDLNAANTGAHSLVHRVVTVASLGVRGDGSGISDHRRFYAAPTVALAKRHGEQLLQVVVGSGYRAHPLDMQTNDRLYVLDDTDALSALQGELEVSSAIRESELLDITNDLNPDPSDFKGRRGWLLRLTGKGEKMLSSAVVVEGVVFATSYLPETVFQNPCQRVVGSSRLYSVRLTDGGPALQRDSDNPVRFVDIVLPGLPPAPQLLTQSPDKLVVLVGTAAIDPGMTIDTSPRRTRWYEVDSREQATQVLNQAMTGSGENDGQEQTSE